MTVLEIAGVSHHYGRYRAVHDVSLSLSAGEILCLVGPSGCGKSTLLRLIAGLERLQAGRVLVGGDVAADPQMEIDVPPDRRGVGLVFQDYALFPHLTVDQNVGFGLSGWASGRRKSRVRAVLEQVEMAWAAHKYPHALSGGQQQRVALARALAPEPRLLLLDEPFSGLDATLRQQIREDTLKVLKESGAATVIVTHDPEEAMFLADRMAVMQAGRLVQLGTPYEVYYRPAEPFVAAFFGELNEIAGVVRSGQVATPFGTIDAGPHAEGTAVRVLIRPEALRLSLDRHQTCNGHVSAQIVESRMLGRSTVLRLVVTSPDGSVLWPRCRVPGPARMDIGTTVDLSLEPEGVFVFQETRPAG